MKKIDVNAENDLKENPKLLRDLIKYKELQIKFNELESNKEHFTPGKKKPFRWKHFFIYIFPALLQIGTLCAAYLAIIKSRLFESANYYAEAKNLKLQIDEDSLNRHKSKLHDSIANFSLQLNRQKSQLESFDHANARLNLVNSSLSKNIVEQSSAIKKLDIQYYGDLIDNYSGAFRVFNNKQVDILIEKSKASRKDADLIKKYIDNILSRKFPDSVSTEVNQIKLSALGFFCFNSYQYRQIFVKNLKLFTHLLSIHNENQIYDEQFMNILRYKRWTEPYINENFAILLNDANNIYQPEKLTQIASWTTFHPLETNDREKIQHMPDFWAKQHDFLLKETTVLFSNDTLTIQDQNFIQQFKSNELSLLCECPQCYLSLEAEVLKKYLAIFKAEYEIHDTVSLTFTARKQNNKAQLYDPENIAKIKFEILLTGWDIENWSQKVFKIYQETVKQNNAISYHEIITSVNFYQSVDLFEKYYAENKDKFKFWLSRDRVKDINKNWFQEKLLTLKF